MSEGGRRHERVEALDGIRGIAVLAVLLFHCSLELQGPWRVAGSWGWMGVDLFFVLSGFLITGILLDARGAPSRFYYGGFYARRLLRIAPAFVALMLALTLAPGLTGQSPAARQLLIAHEGWYWAFCANALIATYGWAGVIPQTAPLWSLAVEEQFYLIWPSVVRHLSAVRVLRLSVVLIVLAASARVVLALRGVSTDTLYVLMPTRADVLAWGAVLAALIRLPNGLAIIRRFLWPALIVAALWIISVMLHFGSSYYWSKGMVMAGYPAVAVGGACLVAIALLYDPAPLRFSWLTQIGKVSYALYLWHMTAIAILTPLTRRLGPGLIPLALLVSLVPTLLSWYAIERPLLSLKRYAPMQAAEQPIVVEPAGVTLREDLSLSAEPENRTVTTAGRLR